MYLEIGDGIYFHALYAETMQLFIGGNHPKDPKRRFDFLMYLLLRR